MGITKHDRLFSLLPAAVVGAFVAIATGGWVPAVAVGALTFIAVLNWSGRVPGFWRTIGSGVAAGAIAGIAVLGVGLRLAMRVVAILDADITPELTVGGTIGIVVLGGMLGIPLGILVALLGRRVEAPVAGMVSAVVGLGMLAMGDELRHELLELGVGWPVNVPMFGAVFYAFGFVAARLAARFRARGAADLVDLVHTAR